MAENFTVSLQKIIDEYQLEVIHTHKNPEEILISENDVNRPGLQLMGFYEYFNPERIQIIGTPRAFAAPLRAEASRAHNHA